MNRKENGERDCKSLMERLDRNAKVFAVRCVFYNGKTAIVEIDEGVGYPVTFTYNRINGEWVIE